MVAQKPLNVMFTYIVCLLVTGMESVYCAYEL